MSLSLIQVQETEFDAMVKEEYRSRGFFLKDKAYTLSDIEGATVQFRRMGQVIASPHAYQSQIVVQDPGYTPITTTLTKYIAAIGIDDTQQFTVNFSVRQQSAIAVAHALGRMSDQVTINAVQAAMAAGNTGMLVPVRTGGAGANANLNYTKLRQVVSWFGQAGVPASERFMVISAEQEASLLADDHFTSRFFTNNMSLVDGTLNNKYALGMNFIVMPDMTEGGLPFNIANGDGNVNATTRASFAFHRYALGIALGGGAQFKVSIEKVPMQDMWLVSGKIFMNAAVIDPRGLVQVNCDEAVIV